MATDSELASLAQDAIDPLNGGDYGNPIPPQAGPWRGGMGLDLSEIGTPEQPSPVAAPIASAPVDDGLALPSPQITDPEVPKQHPPTALTTSGAVQSLNTARDAGMAEADAKAAELPARRQASGLNADAQSEVAQAHQNEADALELKAQAQAKGMEVASAKREAAAQRYKDFQFRDYWKDLSDSDRVKANIFVALGAFNSDNTGGKNIALDRINTLIDQNLKHDTAELNKRGKFAEWAAEGEKDLAARYKDEVTNLRFKHAALSEAAAQEAKAQAIRNGIPVEEAEGHTLVAGLRAKAEKDYAKAYGDALHNAATEAMAKAHLEMARANYALAARAAEEKPPTADESKQARHGRNMTLALDELEKNGLGEYVPSPESMQKWFSNKAQIEGAANRNKDTLGQIANFGMRMVDKIPINDLEGISGKDRAYLDAFGRITEPYARDASGQAISATEWPSFAGQLGLGKGGQEARALREQAARDMVVTGGRATKMLQRDDAARGRPTPGTPASAAPAQSKPSGPPEGATGKAKDGTPVVRRGGKWVAQ